MTHRALAASLSVAAIVMCGAPARADEQHILDLDGRARTAYQSGDYEQAARLFREIFRTRPKPAAKFNEALAWERAKRADMAADAYEAVLAMAGLDAERARAARDHLAQLKKVVGYVVISCPVGATVDAGRGDKIPVPGKFHLAPGAHDLTVEHVSGTPLRRSIDVGAGERMAIDLPCTGEAPAPTAANATTEGERVSREAPKQPTTPSSGPGPWPFITFGGAAAFAGAAVYFGLDFVRTNERYEDGGNRDPDLRDHALRSRLLTNVFLGAAVVSAGAGLYLVLSRRGASTAATGVVVGPRQVSGVVSF